MKRIHIIFLFILLIIICSVSCHQGESFNYKGKAGISFEASTYDIHLGSLPYSIKEFQVKIPLTLIGTTSNIDRNYEIKIIDTLSTAIENIQYKSIPRKFTLKAFSTNDTIYLTIIRGKLNATSKYSLTMQIKKETDLPPLIQKLSMVTINFDNILDMPTWWQKLSYWLGEYDIRKYQKFIELNGTPITSEEMEKKKYEYLRIFKRVKEYFDNHPEEGITFPDVVWEI